MKLLSKPRWFPLLSTWLLLGVCVTSGQEATPKKPLKVEDLYLFENFRSPVLFPDEDKLVCERVWIDAKTKMDRHALWLLSETRGTRKPLEEGEPDGRSPVISPDGQWIAFLSARPDTFAPFPKAAPKTPPYSDPYVDIWLYHVRSAKVIPLGGPDRPWGRAFHDGFYGRIAFSADSARLVFVADDGADPRTKEEIANDVEIVRPDQGEGYTGYGPAQIWIADLEMQPAHFAARKITRLTNDDVWYGDPHWSPDGKTIVVHANKTKDRESVRFSINKNFDLYLIDLASRKQQQLTTNPGPDVSPRFSPSGKQIAYLSVPRQGSHRDVFHLGVVTLEGGVATSRLIVDRPGQETLIAPGFPLPEDCWENERRFLFRDERGTDSMRLIIDVAQASVSGIAKTKFLKLDQRLRTLLPASDSFLNDRYQAKSEIVSWKNEDLDIQGIFTAPPPEIAKPPYKLIVYPHGGPHGRSTLGFDFTVQLFAAHGYAIFQPNFRGSSGYGQKFIDADRFDLGGGDMRDILTGIDKLVKEGKVDPKRQFVYGISYGGFMASWLVGHTQQFRAAVAQNAVTDLNMMWALSDIQSWTHWEFGGYPWEQPERYRQHSPLTHVAKVKTPTLILHAREDRRCPLPMGKAFHQALLANDVPTQMVIYPNEGHGIRQPRHREDIYRRVLAWFEKYDVKSR